METTENRAKEIFLAALALPEDERALYLEAACKDQSLRSRVESLLKHHEAAEEFLSLSTSPLSEEQARALPFKTLADFEVVREIGRGGIGVVYLAREQGLGRRVALKILLPQFALSRRSLIRFQHEARIAARLAHPAIVPIHRYGEEGEIHYIASEYIEGPTLADVLRDHADGVGPRYWQDVRGAVALLIPIAEALAYAHGRGIIHRDIKPSNILIDADQKAYLADFGLAKDVRDDELTMTGDLAGTYLYMSPEQALAKRVRVDHRSDIFSFGVVLYEIASGKRPFGGDSNQEILHAITFSDPLPLMRHDRHLPRDLDSICQKALEKRPDDRYQTAEELVEDLRRFFAGKPVQAKPMGNVRRGVRVARRRASMLVAASLVLIAMAAAFLIGNRQPQEQRVPVRFLSEPPGASISLRPIEWQTGEYPQTIELGTTPLATDVAPNHYRVVLSAGAAGFVELTRRLDAGTWKEGDAPLLIEARLRSTEEVTEDMLLVPAARFIAGVGGVDRQYPNREYSSQGFYIDRTEVSNREYRAFVLDTGYPEPNWWGGQYDPAWDALPAVGVNWFDARAYAEWAGKRLPTRLEWDRAARGTDGRRYPWVEPGADPGEISVSSCTNRYRGPMSAPGQALDLYLQWACPVDSPGGDVGPAGLFHTLGNVSEWSDSVTIMGEMGEANPSYDQRSLRGFNYLFYRPEAGLEVVTEADSHERFEQLWIGFRCAKSLSPDSPPIVMSGSDQQRREAR